MINCVIIDDEPLALNLLENFISKIPWLKMTGRHEEALAAVTQIESENIDLIFLDIKMPDISGIDLYRSLTKKPEVIFTSAYSEYAINGFELNAVDYLLKPVSFEKFVSACNKARDYIDYKAVKNTKTRDYFFINASHKLHKIFYDEIIYMEGLKDYTKIYLDKSSSPLLVLYSLKYFEDILDETDFVRIHRSYIVPIRKLNTVARKSVTIAGKILPVSDNYREKLFNSIE